MQFLKDIHDKFTSFLKKDSAWLVFIAVILTFFAFKFGLDGVLFSNMVWLIAFLVLPLYFFAFIQVAYKRFVAYKECQLKKELATDLGGTYSVYNGEGIKVGEVSSIDYLKAKYTATVCISPKVMQAFNILQVGFMLLIKIIVLLPVFSVLFAGMLVVMSFPEELSSLTLGQVLVAIHEHSDSLSAYLAMTLFVYLSVHLLIARPLPGYVNYHHKRLKLLLAQYVPNIANAESFYVVGPALLPQLKETEQP